MPVGAGGPRSSGRRETRPADRHRRVRRRGVHPHHQPRAGPAATHPRRDREPRPRPRRPLVGVGLPDPAPGGDHRQRALPPPPSRGTHRTARRRVEQHRARGRGDPRDPAHGPAGVQHPTTPDRSRPRRRATRTAQVSDARASSAGGVPDDPAGEDARAGRRAAGAVDPAGDHHRLRPGAAGRAARPGPQRRRGRWRWPRWWSGCCTATG